jgi:uncharacterized protein YndB with AHSA1/START domain
MSQLVEASAPENTRLLTFAASVTSAASPAEVYAVLADLGTHLEWAGKQATDKNLRLLTLTAPPGQAAVGTEFSSTGPAGHKDTFHDHSVVTEVVPGRAIAFRTTARLERGNGRTWRTHFTHRYELEPDGTGTRIGYTCDVVRGNYRPYWLHPLLRRVTRRLMTRSMRKNLENLARYAGTGQR